jgi:glycine/D-amino acid oxidase-like deaminating enzyme
MPLPSHKKYIVVGAGIHGLSTAYHLALTLEAQGKGSGSDVIVLDKTTACGSGYKHCGIRLFRRIFRAPQVTADA